MTSISADSAAAGYEPRRATTDAVALAWSFEKVSASLLLFAIVFFNAADFRGSSGSENFEVHWQIYLRLLICFLSGCFGLLFLLPANFREFLKWPGMLVAAYVLILGVSVITSINFTYSAAAWCSLAGVTLFVPAAMHVLAPRVFLLTVLLGLATHLVGSWIAYLFFPEIGVFQEQVTRTEVYERMGGLAHPNELGFYAALTVLLACGLKLARQIRSWTAVAFALLGTATLLTCFSRTSIVACCVGLAVIYRRQIFLRGNLVAIAAAGTLATLAVFAAIGTGQFDWAIQDLLTGLTKSGSVDELATATGRTEIWRFAVQMIAEEPLLGFGHCTQRFVMEEHSYHGHNVVLNAMLSGGIFAGAVVVVMILVQIVSISFQPCWEIDGLAAFIICTGMVDGVFPAASPTGLFAIWIATLLWRQMQMECSRGELIAEHGF